jgi:nicotinamidase/pyrazinamidase
MKKLLIRLAIAVAVLIGVCFGYVVVSFQKMDGVSTGPKIAQNQPDKPALLVIDIQEGITGKTAPKFTQNMVLQSVPFIEKVNQTINLAQSKNMPVIYIRQENTDKLFNILFKNFMAKGSPSAALDPRVKVVEGPVFTKSKMDAFSNPQLEEFLKTNNINHLYVTGLSAMACVDRTIKAALNRGYAVSAITDAIIGEKVEKTEVNYREWEKANAVLLQADQFR